MRLCKHGAHVRTRPILGSENANDIMMNDGLKVVNKFVSTRRNSLIMINGRGDSAAATGLVTPVPNYLSLFGTLM